MKATGPRSTSSSASAAAPVVASYALSPVWTVLAPADLPAVFDESFAP